MQLPGRSALVIAVLAALTAMSACRAATTAPSGREALASAVSTTLPFHARLSGGFAPSKVGPTRAAGDRPVELSPDTRIAIALLEKRATDNPTPQAQADLGVGYLVQGDIDKAIATIEDAASQMTAAAPWSDLSAAYLAKAERTPSRKVEYLARGLEAAEKSLKIARTNDALFNRALARDGLAPYTGSPAPWSEYTSGENDPAWRQVATQEAINDRPIEDANARWEARRKELTTKLKAGDAEFVKETVRLFPEASIEFLEQEVFVDPTAIRSASMLASAIHEMTRDVMMRDEVAALRANGAALWRAHQVYAKGVTQYDANQLSDARKSFTEALAAFTHVRAPYQAWAETQLALLDWHNRAFDEAQQRLTTVERKARANGYATLLGRLLWQRGLVFNRQWRLNDGLAAFRESVSTFEAAREPEYAASLYSNLADALRMLGEPNESWAYIGRSLEQLGHVRKPTRRYLFLYNAALFASQQELHQAALLFQDATVREADQAGTDVLTEALVHRALVNLRLGDQARASADFERASRQVTSNTADEFKVYINAELDIVRAQLPGSRDAVQNLQEAIAFFSRTEPGRVPGLYLLMARTPQARASRDIAEKALRSGIEHLESQQADLSDETLRISFFDESWALFQDMVALQVAAKNSGKAFEYAERSRARSLLAAAQGTSTSRTRALSEIQANLPASTVMLHYSTLADRVLMWTITASGTTLTERPIAERDLSRLIEQHRAAIRDHRENEANNRLYELLIQPVGSKLAHADVVVLVPDAQLQQLPFATLRHPSSKRYLIEEHPLVVSPSASFFVDAREAAAGRPGTAIESALLVGNPSAGGARSLPGAEAEVETASKLYRRHEILVGATATKDRFLEMAPAFDVVHFGGHAIVNSEFPLLSRLVFADQAEGEQSLYAHEIARLRFPRTRVVVLAACSTAVGAVSRGEGVVSVARPFLGGGVPLVIASQWDVDDRATEQLTLVFHRELAKSGNPIHALQAAQLALLRSGDAVQASPESWGAFVAVGTAAP